MANKILSNMSQPIMCWCAIKKLHTSVTTSDTYQYATLTADR